MIAIDTNLWVYAHRKDMNQHLASRDVVTDALKGSEQVMLCWPVVHEFLSVVTNRKIFKEPTPMKLAVQQIRGWLASPVVITLQETPNHLPTLAAIALQADVVGSQIHDARIAAICVEHGVRELWTADRGYEKFEGIRVRNPLV